MIARNFPMAMYLFSHWHAISKLYLLLNAEVSCKIFYISEMMGGNSISAPIFQILSEQSGELIFLLGQPY